MRSTVSLIGRTRAAMDPGVNVYLPAVLAMLDTMMARTHTVTTRDRAAFRALLGRVLQTPASIWPEQRLANELAHRKARRYLAHEARFF